jgi:demethylspheroidene O-methyltransferase
MPDTLRDRFLEWRSRMVARPAFRRFASRFLPTRPVARRETAALFDLCSGFVYSQVLAAFVRLGAPELLAKGPASAVDFAAATGLDVEAADRLLKAAVALRLAETRSRNRFGLGGLGAALVDNPGVRAMIEHHAILYRDLEDPVALLRGETRPALAEFWAYEPGGGDRRAAYSKLMAASQQFIADEVLDALPLSRCRRLMDVGGGAGIFLDAAGRRHPSLELVLFDLPEVADIARRSFAAAGLAGRAVAVGGDFRRDPLPSGADFVTLVRVLHDHDDAVALDLLKAIRKALPAQGVLALAEPMSETPGAEASGDAYFGFYLMAMGRGRPRSFARIAELGHAAGFSRIRALKTATPLLVRITVMHA